jgi:alpha-tubulin suppressor-like RCC1 family protein
LLQNGGKETKLDDSSQGENATRQRDAAKDFLKLGEVHLAKEASRVELVDYYLYKGPNAESLKVPGHEHEFDSALLPGEGVTEEQGHPAENPRQAYCVLALGLETCPAVPHTEAAVPGTITASGGAVSLTLDPGGAVTKYQVEYGTSEGYGKTTATATAANENGDQSETVTLSGLEPCTTYHYQAEAENKANEEEKAPGLGGDRTFRTEGSCPATAVSAGFQHVCALRANGVVDCWGADYQGELGNGKIEEGDSTETFAPGQVDDISNATEVSDHEGSGSCALLTTHSVECWGDNSDGQDGNGGEEPESTPVAVSGIADATEVSVGDYDACAVLSTGGVDCWGSNEYGELGDGTMTGPAKCGREPCSRVPVSVSGISNAIAVEAGSRHTCALLSTGHADCWGWNEFGSLGDSSTTNSSTPVEVSGITNATAITGGGDPCALLATGHIKCWGPGGEGGIGNGTDASSTKPEEVSEISNAVAIASNEGQSCALLSTHHIECWGRNEQGELGDGTHTGPEKCEPSYCSTKPVAVSEITDATAISAGFEDSCAVLAGGTVDCWGSNGYGQLGYKPTEELEMRSLPVEISGIP